MKPKSVLKVGTNGSNFELSAKKTAFRKLKKWPFFEATFSRNFFKGQKSCPFSAHFFSGTFSVEFEKASKIAFLAKKSGQMAKNF